MKSSNFTYILIVVAVAAVGLSIRGYVVLGNHQVQQITPVEQLMDATVQQTVTAKSATQTSVVPTQVTAIVAKTSTKKDTEPAPQTAAVAPVKPTTPVTQTPVVVPVIVYSPISLPYNVDNFPHNNSWRAIIGSLDLKFVDGPYKRNLLTTSASEKTVDGFIELGGSEGWQDYSFTAKINFISGPVFSLIGRYKDSKNYTVCTFSEGGVTRINSVVDGKNTVITENKDQIPTIPNVVDISYGMHVKGNNVQCLVNGSAVNATISDMPSMGGIGFDVYNQTPGSSELDVKEINVTD